MRSGTGPPSTCSSVSEARANYDRIHAATAEPKPERRYAGAAN